MRNKSYPNTLENLYQDSKESLASLPRQMFFTYICFAIFILILSVTGLTRVLLVPGLFVGVLLIAWDEMNHLASIDVRRSENPQMALRVEVDNKEESKNIFDSLRQSIDLPEEYITWMVNIGSKKTLPPGQVLIRESTPIDALYFVLSGQFEISTTNKFNRVGLTSNRKRISQIDSSQVLGEMSFVGTENYLPSATVKALSESCVWSIPRSVLNKKLKEDPTFGSQFYNAIAFIIAKRLRATNAMWADSDKGASRAGFNLSQLIGSLLKGSKSSEKLSSSSFLDMNPGLILHILERNSSMGINTNHHML